MYKIVDEMLWLHVQQNKKCRYFNVLNIYKADEELTSSKLMGKVMEFLSDSNTDVMVQCSD